MANITSKINSSLLGESIQIVELRSLIRQVAPTDVTVLITGESGSGKEVVANEIHKLSKRSENPFITVNCGAIPEGLIESELFGHTKGSFTGAFETRKGYFEAASRGTIFLDEIGELPPATQVKFLRIIEAGEFVKVGGTKTEKVDVRIIAATNKNLENLMANNSFREDLYYRLRSINIHIPPLRDRKEDILLLLNYFAGEFSKRNNIIFNGISDEATIYVTNYSWPGNVRQLRNFTESIITLYPDKKIELNDVLKQLNISPQDNNLPAVIAPYKGGEERQLLFGALFELKRDIMDIKSQLAALGNAEHGADREDGFFISDEKIDNLTFDDFEQELLSYYWKKYNGNINRIASRLKISNRTLYRKFKVYGLKNGKVH